MIYSHNNLLINTKWNEKLERPFNLDAGEINSLCNSKKKKYTPPVYSDEFIDFLFKEREIALYIEFLKRKFRKT